MVGSEVGDAPGRLEMEEMGWEEPGRIKKAIINFNECYSVVISLCGISDCTVTTKLVRHQ